MLCNSAVKFLEQCFHSWPCLTQFFKCHILYRSDITSSYWCNFRKLYCFYWLGWFLLLSPHLKKRLLYFSLHHISLFFNQNYMKILISFYQYLGAPQGKCFTGKRYCCLLNATLLFSKVTWICHLRVCKLWSYLFLWTYLLTFHICSNMEF